MGKWGGNQSLQTMGKKQGVGGTWHSIQMLAPLHGSIYEKMAEQADILSFGNPLIYTFTLLMSIEKRFNFCSPGIKKKQNLDAFTDCCVSVSISVSKRDTEIYFLGS